MKASTLVFCLTVLLGAALCSTAEDPQSTLLNQRREAKVSDKTKELFKEMLKGFRSASMKFLESIKEFMKGLVEQLPTFQTKFSADIEKLRQRLKQVKETARGGLKSSGSAALNCIEAHSDQADLALNSAVSNALSCADDRISDVSKLISELTEKAERAAQAADDALKKMMNCVANSSGILSIRSCLASKTELKAVSLLTESGFLSDRINMARAKLSAALEACARTQLMEAGLTTTRIMSDMEKCSAASATTTLTDPAEPSTDFKESLLQS